MDHQLLELLAPTVSPPHDSASLHVQGKSEYIDDIPAAKNELYAGLVTSPHGKATINYIRVSEAIKLGAFCFTHQDLAHNRWGSIMEEQPLLAKDGVNYAGEVVVVVAAADLTVLRAALKAVEVSYSPSIPILSIKDAILQKSFITDERKIERGDVSKALKNAPFRLHDELFFQGADHFYLENQAVRVVPNDDETLTVFSSTQHPTEVQMMVAECLGIPMSHVCTITKRLGGGFGGKETQAAPFAVYAALVAKKLNCPARLVLSKDEDMIMTGKRNPYLIQYEVGFDEQGLITGLDCYFYGDGGAYADLSPAILERALAHADNAYFLPHARIRGRVCRTNVHSHTAFRGFGGPKGVGMIEHIMESIGRHLSIDPLTVRMNNCYQGNRNITPYGQIVENNLLPQLFSTLKACCTYEKRRTELDAFNKKSTTFKKGMSLTAIKFGISFTTRFLNQGHAFIHVYRDGTIQVNTGGVEMGQGVNARIKALVAEEFGVALQHVRIMPTSTEKCANTSPTAASSGTDLNGTAAVIACRKIKRDLTFLFDALKEVPKDEWPARTQALGLRDEVSVEHESGEIPSLFSKEHVTIKEHKVSLTELINAAYLSRIPLSAYGFYKVPHLHFDKIRGVGSPFLYFTQGTACSEVLVDMRTGEVKILKTDILMDLGTPINDALDRGQIAGGFVQGVGWMLHENLVYSDEGLLLTRSPSTYKIPSIHDIPREWSIELVKNTGNHKNIRGTKASGEPPLMLCFSVWNAVKDALYYATGSLPNLPIPATSEQILRVLYPDRFNGL